MLRALVVAALVLASPLLAEAQTPPYYFADQIANAAAGNLSKVYGACSQNNFSVLLGANQPTRFQSIRNASASTIPTLPTLDWAAHDAIAAYMDANGCATPPKPASVAAAENAWLAANGGGGSGGGGSNPPPTSCTFSDPTTWTKVAVAGDSRTAVVSTKPTPCSGPNCNTSSHRWPHMLYEWTAAEVVIVGGGGSSADVVSTQLPAAIAAGAQGIIVETGANDAYFGVAPTQTQTNITTIITTGRAAGLDVIVVGLGPVITSGGSASGTRAAYQAAIEAAVNGACARYLDGMAPFRSLYRNPAESYSADDIPDGIHYSARGARKRAEQVGNAIFR